MGFAHPPPNSPCSIQLQSDSGQAHHCVRSAWCLPSGLPSVSPMRLVVVWTPHWYHHVGHACIGSCPGHLRLASCKRREKDVDAREDGVPAALRGGVSLRGHDGCLTPPS